ncbi:MAG: hypothetical protein ACYCWE_05625 [Eubacteriales bacterium]
MKKYVLILIILVCVAEICSCTNTISEDDVLRKMQKYDYTINAAIYDYQKDLAEWLSPENEYVSISDSDSSNNIIRIFDNDYIIKENRLYFRVKRDNNDMWAYVSLLTGEKFYLCPDPLCPHTEESGCKYLNLKELIFVPDSENLIYTVKTYLSDNGAYEIVCLLDTENDTFHELFKSDSVNVNVYNMYDLCFINDEYLYFTNTCITREKAENGEVEQKIEEKLMTLNRITNEVNEINNKYSSQEYGKYFFADDRHIFFINFNNKKFFATDLNFENEQTILDYGKEFNIRNFFYDKGTSEFYVLINSDYMFGTSNNEITEGSIYCVNSNLEYRKLEMPSEKIADFKLTNGYIYYAVYDPVYYGITPWGIQSTDITGNKIFRVNRNNTAKSELVFDGHGQLFYNYISGGYIVTGDYIYMDYCALMKEENTTWFRRMGSTAKINFKDQTIKWLNFD